MAITEAQKRAIKKYRKEKMETIDISVQKELKAQLQLAAQKRGMSLARFLLSPAVADAKSLGIDVYNAQDSDDNTEDCVN